MALADVGSRWRFTDVSRTFRGPSPCGSDRGLTGIRSCVALRHRDQSAREPGPREARRHTPRSPRGANSRVAGRGERRREPPSSTQPPAACAVELARRYRPLNLARPERSFHGRKGTPPLSPDSRNDREGERCDGESDGGVREAIEWTWRRAPKPWQPAPTRGLLALTRRPDVLGRIPRRVRSRSPKLEGPPDCARQPRDHPDLPSTASKMTVLGDQRPCFQRSTTNSIAIVGVVRDRGVAPEGAQTAAGRTHPHLPDPAACGARGRSRQGKTAVLEHALAHAPAPSAWLTCTPLGRDPGQLLARLVGAFRPRSRRHRADMGFRRHRPRPCGDPIAFCGRGWRDD
jgi:hypothetical protein